MGRGAPQHKPKRLTNKAQTTAAHQPACCEFQEYLEFQESFLEISTGEIGKITIESMIKEHIIYFYMTVYVRPNSGKTISIKCDKRQNVTRIKDEIERKTKIPTALQHLSNQGKN